jgi:Transposase IS116/IS110/IS902 family
VAVRGLTQQRRDGEALAKVDLEVGLSAADPYPKAVAKDLVTEIRTLDTQLKANAQAIARLVAATGSTLTEVVGVGPIMAGRLISRTGRASRFLTASAFANYAGAAPVEIASAEKSRHRLSRHGDRQLNSALHTIAITQIHTPSSRGHRYYKSKIAEGNTTRGGTVPQETPRRPPLADHDQRRTAGSRPGRTTGDDSAIQRGWSNPNDQLFGQVTSRTRQPRLYDGPPSRLTNTEAPKGTDLSKHSTQHLLAVENELNNRPRLVLNDRAPAELFGALLTSQNRPCCDVD